MSRTTDFDKEETITKAMNIFWTKGYEGTTMRDLQTATGLQKGSLYNTFKSKENLFLLCLEKYGANSATLFYVDGDPKNYIKKFFKRLVDEGVKEENVSGCLIMNSCIEFSNTKSAPAKKSKDLFATVEKNFENVVNAIKNKTTHDTHELKTNLITAAFSIREISKFKKDKKFLKQIANNVLKELDIAI
ncbi:TetR/AcrR family transcriptional regulator [Halobacteriovorax sp.]|uniref:TetR/AcrR family transcriptional regulator n=1 Tax=Halobacteriovorax sp. TaxID=2020862 RepID=UPI003562FA37